MEKFPSRLRGVLSGLLQEGYAAGYLLAAIYYFFLFERWGWRPMFFLGGLPALLALYVRSHVKESEVWKKPSMKPGRTGPLDSFSLEIVSLSRASDVDDEFYFPRHTGHVSYISRAPLGLQSDEACGSNGDFDGGSNCGRGLLRISFGPVWP